ncbi:TadE/TadG family type IV pilus assembly protein [Aquamicrobium terrae]
MTMAGAGALQMLRALTGRIIRFGRDRHGVAAVEFAFIAPIMLILYFITIEAVQGIETSRQVSRLGAMVADLVGQQDTMSKEALTGIMQIGETTMRPYNRSAPTITVTAIKISSDQKGAVPTVAWSGKLVNGLYAAGPAKNTTVTVPPELKIGDSFLIRVESNLGYKPVIAWSDKENASGLTGIFNNIEMNEVYYARPRIRREISCTNC